MKTMRNRNMEGLLARRSEGGDRLKEEEGFDWGMLNPLESKYLGGDREFDPMYGMGKLWDAGKNWLGSFGDDDEEKAKVMKEYKDPEEGYHSVGEEAYMNYGRKGSDSDFGENIESKMKDDEGVGGDISRGLSRTLGLNKPSAEEQLYTNPAFMPTMHDAPEYAAEQEAWKKMAEANPDQFEKEKIAAANLADRHASIGSQMTDDQPELLGRHASIGSQMTDGEIPVPTGPQMAGRHAPVAGPVDGPSPHAGMPVAESLLAPEDTKKKKKKKGLSKAEKAGYAKMGEMLMDSGSAPDMRPPTAPALSITQGQIAFPGLLAQQAPVQQRYTP